MSFHYGIESIPLYSDKRDKMQNGNRFFHIWKLKKNERHNRLLQFTCSDFLKQVLPSFSIGCKLLRDLLLRQFLTSVMSRLHYRRDRDDITKPCSCKVKGMVSLMKRPFTKLF